MRKPKKSKCCSAKKSVDWVYYIDKDAPRLVVPVGPRFQAKVPELTKCSSNKSEPYGGNCLDDSSWLGTRMWPISENRSSNKIGKGRPDSCACAHPGSVKCADHHVAEERKVLMSELGPAFNEWKLDTMGEEVSKSWTAEQQKSFECFVRNRMSQRPTPKDQTFFMSALTSFPSKTQEEIVSYYFNVHVLRHFRQQIRSGSLVIDTDDETEITAQVYQKLQNKDTSQNVKPRYLVGRR